MINRLMGALFAPRYPRYYTGRHRAPARIRMVASRPRPEQRMELA